MSVVACGRTRTKWHHVARRRRSAVNKLVSSATRRVTGHAPSHRDDWLWGRHRPDSLPGTRCVVVGPNHPAAPVRSCDDRQVCARSGGQSPMRFARVPFALSLSECLARGRASTSSARLAQRTGCGAGPACSRCSAGARSQVEWPPQDPVRAPKRRSDTVPLASNHRRRWASTEDLLWQYPSTKTRARLSAACWHAAESTLGVMALSIDYSLRGVGWATCRVTLDEESVDLAASYLSDALGNLVLAACMAYSGFHSLSFGFDEEPGEYRWAINRVDGTYMTLRLLEFDELWSNASNQDGRQLLVGKMSIQEFVNAVHRAAHAVLKEHGQDGYREKWAGHPFP